MKSPRRRQLYAASAAPSLPSDPCIERFSEPAVYGSQKVARLHQEGSESRYRIERFSNVSEESEFVSAIADVLLRKTIQVTCRITVPSEMFGGETSVLAAFFAIQ